MWKLIDEAPKDGTVIDVWDTSYERRETDVSWRDGKGWCKFVYAGTYGQWESVNSYCFSHFMKIPKPPKGR